MQPPMVSDQQQQQVWPLQTHPPQLQLGQLQVLLPDAHVASMQLQPADPVKLGFMCGSLPVPTFNPSDITSSTSEAALIPAISSHNQRAVAPRYRVLPTETDLNMPPSNSFDADPTFPVSVNHEAAGSCKAWAGSYLSQPLARKCEALAVNALAGYSDDIDVVAPVDILKQLFKTPYSKARLSLAVHRIGRTLILNSGPDEWKDERAGGKLPSQKKSHAQMMERTLFSKFVQHSMNGESCDTASTPDSDSQSASSNFGFEDFNDHELQQRSTSRMAAHHKGKHRVSLGHYRHSRCGGRFETVQKKRYAGEQRRETEFGQTECPAEGPQRPTSESYLRVLFWQFQNLRMLLGSDLLLFSNENHSAVSLHLLEIERQVTPLMWLDAWLDNVMASVPELAVCYHRNGVVQGYELLKTDDIFLVKGLAEDGTAFFHPHVVQKNASTVLRFLQENCKQDPGTYWLLKNSGEELMQLFDLSVISKTCSSSAEKDEKSGGTLPSTRSNCREQYSLPLAMLLYRLTHRLSLSQDPADWRKCAKLFGKCLEFMEEQEHLIIRASAHEHVARLILTSFKEIGSMLKPLLLESSMGKGTVNETKKAVLELPSPVEQPAAEEDFVSATTEVLHSHENEVSNTDPAVTANLCDKEPELSLKTLIADCRMEDGGRLSQTSLEPRISTPEGVSVDSARESSTSCLEAYTHVDVEETADTVVEPDNALGFVSAANPLPESLLALTDPVSARLSAVHHISQAIKSLRWQRQLDIGDHPLRSENTLQKQPSHNPHFPLCICGEGECVAICDFREIGLGAQMDQKLWRLMLLLGEAYLALGQAYKDGGQLSRALKAAELACLVCGSMPQVSDTSTCGSNAEKDSPSSWNTSNAASHKTLDDGGDKYLRPSEAKLLQIKDRDRRSTDSAPVQEVIGRQQGLFWGRVWMFVGDVYVEIQRSVGEGNVASLNEGSPFEELTMAQEVMKEVKRLKKKIGQLQGSCGMCSLTSCSCQSDRASSGNSASSCNSSVNTKYGQKHNKKTNSKSHSKVRGDSYTELKNTEDESGRSVDREYSISMKGVANEDLKEVYGILDGGSTATKLLTTGTEKEKVSGAGSCKPGDIFSYLRRPMMVNWEANLSAAVECYGTATIALTGFSECIQDLELTLRKKGWGCNELGRMRLAHGHIKSAEVAFATAIEAFRDVKDPVNVVLVHCNLGHGQRAAAEALAAKLNAWESCDFVALFVQTIAESKFLYGEALKFYGMARRELLGDEDKVGQSMGGLWTEVHTQLAHTYLRLGMLLAREDKFVYDCRKSNAERRTLGSNDRRDRQSRIKDETPTKDAITKALEIYKSLGSLRTQEAAFAQYQLACHHRDSCRNAATQRDDIVLKKVGSSSFQRAKLHATLADLYWQKALDFYQPKTHADMFLDILMERSALCVLMATTFSQNQMMEQALNLLLEARRALASEVRECSVENVDSWEAETLHERPSAKVIGRLTQQVQMLLRDMLAAAMLLNKSTISASIMDRPGKSHHCVDDREMHSTLIRTGDAAKLKQMYRTALQTTEEPNLELLFRMWGNEVVTTGS